VYSKAISELESRLKIISKLQHNPNCVNAGKLTIRLVAGKTKFFCELQPLSGVLRGSADAYAPTHTCERCKFTDCRYKDKRQE